MNVTELARVLLRWRWVLLPVLVLAIAAGVAGHRVTPPTYSQTERYLLLSPVVTEQGVGNPFLQLGNGVSMAAGVLMTKVASGQIADEVTQGVPGAAFTVAGDPSTSAPIVVVTAEGATPSDVAGVLDRAGDELVDQLAQLQRATGAPQVSWVTIGQLTRDPEATRVDSARIRTAAVGSAGVLVVGLALVLLLERRRRARAELVARTATAAGGVPADRDHGPLTAGARTGDRTSTAPPAESGWSAGGAGGRDDGRSLTDARAGTAEAGGQRPGLLGSARVS